jgi:hypothetical protein
MGAGGWACLAISIAGIGGTASTSVQRQFDPGTVLFMIAVASTGAMLAILMIRRGGGLAHRIMWAIICGYCLLTVLFFVYGTYTRLRSIVP